MLLVIMGLAGSLQFLSEGYWWGFGAPHPDPSELSQWAVKLSAGAATIGFAGMLVFLPILFPDGKPHRRWTAVVAGLIFVLVAVQFTGMLLTGEPMCVDEISDGSCNLWIEDPPGIEWIPSPAEPPLQDIFGPLIMFGIIGGLLAAVSRYRASTGEARLQMKWFAFAAGIAVLIIPPAIMANAFAGVSVLEWVFNLPFSLMPLAVAVAILRHRLYEIDRIISRTVTYAVVVGSLASAVAVVATAVGTRFQEPWIVAVTTLGVAALFNPVRQRVQVWVDRRFNRNRYDTEQVMDAFAGSLRDQVEAGEVIGGWVDVVDQTMQPSAISVWVRP